MIPSVKKRSLQSRAADWILYQLRDKADFFSIPLKSTLDPQAKMNPARL